MYINKVEEGDLDGFSSQVSSMDSGFSFDAGDCKFELCQCHWSHEIECAWNSLEQGPHC